MTIDVTFSVPFYPVLSKNRGYFSNRRRKPETIKAQEDIAYSLMAEVQKHEWRKQGLIEVWIMVYYEREGTDAHNFEDLVLDALEMGSGVNDRWMKPVHIDGWKVKEDHE